MSRKTKLVLAGGSIVVLAGGAITMRPAMLGGSRGEAVYSERQRSGTRIALLGYRPSDYGGITWRCHRTRVVATIPHPPHDVHSAPIDVCTEALGNAHCEALIRRNPGETISEVEIYTSAVSVALASGKPLILPAYDRYCREAVSALEDALGSKVRHLVGAEASLEVYPNVGIGPVSLGSTRATVENRLGPGRPGEVSNNFIYEIDGATIDVIYDDLGRAYIITTFSPRATYKDVSLAFGFEAVRDSLPGWQVADCPPGRPPGDSIALFEKSADGNVSTSTTWSFFPDGSGAVQIRRDPWAPEYPLPKLTCVPPLD
jgi:hypothetical protein